MSEQAALPARLHWMLADVDPARMKVLALMLRDPNPIHFDPVVAGEMKLRGLVNQGPSNMAMIYNLFDANLPDHRVRRLSVRFMNNVVAGDAVQVVAELAEDHPVPTYDVTVSTLDGMVALSGAAEIEPASAS